jgi:hypothetical protein
MSRSLELFFFTSDSDLARRGVDAGLDGIVIDWERVGKEQRQVAADTEINLDTVDDLRRVRAATDGRILCRINPVAETTGTEIQDAISAGADEVLVPMVRTRDEVETAFEHARGEIAVGILIETLEAVEAAAELGTLPLSRVYLGLNDLAIDRGSASIFSAIRDGTVERVRDAIRVPFGFAGMTLPEAGDPIPCRLLVGELARVRCEFTFLRRSFRRDVRGRDLGVEVPRMRDAFRAAFERGPDEVRRDRNDLDLRLAALEAPSAASIGVHA